MSAAAEAFTAITPTTREVERGQRVRRVWAELTRAQAAGDAMPGMRELARRCRLPSCSTAQGCVDVLVALGAVAELGRHEPSAATPRRRVTSALRVVRPYGWEIDL